MPTAIYDEDVRHADYLLGAQFQSLRGLMAEAIAQERERCAKLADSWSRADSLRLHAGEMTAQEMRTAQAVARGIAAAIRSAT